ncbi:MAG: hypothetical protein AB8B72_05425 [Crocinitomicaceae bacterium]
MRLLLFLCFISSSAFSQELADTSYGRLYRNSYTVGIHFNTSGWGFYGEMSKQKTYKYHHVVGLQISNIHHKNEFKTSTVNQNGTFFYYKLNSLVAMRPTFGGNLLLFESRRENGIQIHYKWKAGPSFGLLKPIHLKIAIPGSISGSIEQRYNPENHGYSDIVGRANWVRGLGQSKMQLGIHSKHGFNFNFAREKDGISGGEIGFMFDYYPFSEVEIMYEAENYRMFSAFYLQFELGNRF